MAEPNVTLDLPEVGIIECRSQTTLLIERTLRELGHRATIVEPRKALSWFTQNPVKLIIPSGGLKSVTDPDAPELPREILDLKKPDGDPVHLFGICYGEQKLAHMLGGRVEKTGAEYGKTTLEFAEDSVLVGTPFHGLPRRQEVWMNHGDSVIEAPAGFTIYSRSVAGGIAAMGDGRNLFGVQFHPEVTHTEYGKEILRNMLRLAGCTPDWAPTSIGENIQQSVLEAVGSAKVVLPFSGGVDSSTAARILSRVFGKDRIIAVTVDAGQLRENELKEIRRNAYFAGIQLVILDVKAEAAVAMSGLVGIVERRLTFQQKVYFPALFEFCREVGARYLVQGSLAPDFIESGLTGGDNIKSHHNVGYDEEIRAAGFIPLHPLSSLFKYEVRVLAQEWGLPRSVAERHPFPGPGLYLRVLGGPSSPENVKIVRWATARNDEILKKHGLFRKVSQPVVTYLDIPFSGIKGEKRAYAGMAIVRAVQTIDFMTAAGVHFSEKVEDAYHNVLTQHPKINGVLFDSTDKPPRTVESQ